MISLHGIGVSSGISIGKAHVLQRERPEIQEYVLPKHLVEEEVDRFTQAIDAARRQLELIRNHIPAGAPSEAASFLDTHLLMLQDTMLSQAPIETIRGEQRNAEWALLTHGQRLVAMFEKMDDPYLRTRKEDVNQIIDRVLRNLLVSHDYEADELTAGQIIIANELTPADTVLLKHKRVRAFVTNMGGPISHTAILARSLGIPAVVTVHSATRYIRNGDEVIVDGDCGVLLAEPAESILAEYRKRQKEIIKQRKELENLRTSRSVTRDGHQVKLFANIELPADIKAAQRASADGIGLYRTEFLYMNRRDLPSEEEQFRNYIKVVKAIGKKPITIRTLDLGADKQVDGGRAGPQVSANPAMGLRAIRLCLHDTTLFRPQLRAILRTSAYGNVRIMIPMLSSLDELFRVLDLIEETKSELKRKKTKFNPKIPVGGMIEVPAAAISVDLFAPYLDFLSLGTNDLIQYTLAVDRVDDTVNYLYDPLHPSVLRLISMTIVAGKKARIPVAMCGEMAGDKRYTRLLLGMGLTEFSMHPASLLEVKKIVRGGSFSQLRRFARGVLQARDVGVLHKMVDTGNVAAANPGRRRRKRKK